MRVFQNREVAAQLLAQQLAHYQGKNPLVLAIPRGAVPMAYIIAQSLGGQMDVVLVHKLGAPTQPELAIGAVEESGAVYLNAYVKALKVPESYLVQEQAAQLAMLQARRALYSPLRASIDLKGRIVLLVDDGIATGSTMVTALQAIRAKHPARLVAVTAVASDSAFHLISQLADEVVCLEVPDNFYAVGQFFMEFPQVSDEAVVALLKEQSQESH